LLIGSLHHRCMSKEHEPVKYLDDVRFDSDS
jgi:hypothetical protein